MKISDDLDFAWLTPAIAKYELRDDDTPEGGIDFPGETVLDFLLESCVDDHSLKSLDDLNALLKSCGIQEVRPRVFEIEYREVCYGYFDVEAYSEEEAVDNFWYEVGEGRIDLLKTDVAESDATVLREIKF